MKKLYLWIKDEDYDVLSSLSKENNISVNAIIRTLIELHKTDKIPLPKLDAIDNRIRREHKTTIRFSNAEFEYLKALAHHNDFTTVNKLIQFIMIDLVYTKHAFTPIEITGITDAANQVRRVGISLNQLVKSINDKNANVSIKAENFQTMLELIYEKIQAVYNEAERAYAALDNRWQR